MKTISDLAKRLKQECDELKLHTKLGQKEAADYFEEKKENFGEFVSETKDSLDKVAKPATDKIDAIHQDLDELKLQLALGRMEGRDAFEEQKEKIEKAINKVWEGLRDIEEDGEEAFRKTRQRFANRSGAFRTKLELLGLNVKSHLSEDEEQLRGKAEQAHEEIDKLVEQAGEKVDWAGHEIHGAWKTLRDKIRHLGKNSKD